MTIYKPNTPSSKFDKAQHLGRVIVAGNRERRHDIETVHGTTDATHADLVSLGVVGTEAVEAEVFLDQLSFGNFGGCIAPNPGEAADGVSVGVLAQGTASAGYSAPWLLEELTADQLVAVEAYLSEHSSFTDDRRTFAGFAGEPF